MAKAKANMTVRLAWGSVPLAMLAAALLLAVLHGPLTADDSATTWDFEGDDALKDWASFNADVDLVRDESGNTTAAITITNTLSWLRLRRDVPIASGHSYTFGGDYVSQSQGVKSVRLQIRVSDDSGWVIHNTTPARVPPESQSESFDASCSVREGQYRVLVEGAIGTTAFVDNLFLKEVAVWTVCPTPLPTPTHTPTPSASPTPTATDTPTPTHTPTPMSSPTPVTTPAASSTSAVNDTATSTQTPTPTTTPSSNATASPSPTDAPTPSTVPSPSATATEPSAANTPTPTPAQDAGPVALDLEFKNGGFEDAEEGRPVAWQTVGGLLMQAETPAHSGSWSGAFFSSTSSTKWAYQTVAVEPTSWYQFDAFVYNDDPWVDAAFLRISWYTSADGRGSALSTIDSTATLESQQPEFRLLSTGSVMAPPGVHSAKLRVLMRPRDATNAIIYIDAVSFARSAAPAPPPTATAPATATIIATPSPSATTPIAATSTPLPPTATPTTSTSTLPATPTATLPPASTPTAIATTAAQDPPAPNTPAREIANAGFEEALEGTLTGWQTYGGLLSRTAFPVRSGSAAGVFFSSSSSTKWVFQTVAVDATSWYQFDAFVHHDHAWVESAFLRISWYASTDGSGSALVSVDSTTPLTAPVSAYRLLSTGAVQAPPGAHSAKLRVMMRPRDGTSALIYIDDASFQQVTEPAFTPPQQAGEQSAAPRIASTARTLSPAVTQSLAVARTQPLRDPMSAPVIRRHTLRTPDQLATPRHNDGPLWPWALVGAATGASVVGWTSYLAQRRRLQK